MALRPSVVIQVKDAPPSRGLPTDTGKWFVAGLTERGPDDAAILLRSMADYDRVYGARVSYGVLYDSLETFFKEGGKEAYVGRVVGPAKTKATKTLNDRAGSPLPTLRVDAYGPGAWGANVTVEVQNGSVSNTYVLIFVYNGVEVERTPDLANPQAAVAWSAGSSYVRITDLGSATAAPNNNPAVLAASALVGGTDDRTNITDTQWLNALNLFVGGYGPGQVSAPGQTTSARYTQVQAHASANNRRALLDAADTATIATVTSAADAQRTNGRFSGLIWPWIKVPAIDLISTQRVVPPCALLAGLIARSDATMHPNTAAAGDNGVSRTTVALSQAAVTDTVRDQLNSKGVMVIREMYGGFRNYGFRSLADPINDPDWINFANSRLLMAIVAQANEIAEQFILKPIDGQRILTNQFGGELKGMLLDYWKQNALFGATSEEAFFVDVGDAVNTPTTMQNNELHADISLKMSPFAELVIITIVKLMITEEV